MEQNLLQYLSAMEKAKNIEEKMTIGEIVQKYPKTSFIFIEYGLHCIGCPAALNETLEEASKLHQIDLQKFLQDLNKAADQS